MPPKCWFSKLWVLAVCLVVVPLTTQAAAQTAAQIASRGVTLSFAQAVAAAAAAPVVELTEGQLKLAQQQLASTAARVSGSVSTTYTQTLPATARAAAATVTADQASSQAAAANGFGAVTLAASLNVVPYGDVADRVTRARWAVMSAQAALEDARAKTVLGVASQYLTALRYDQEKNALAAALKVAQTALSATQTRLRAGAASSADVLAAQIILSQAQNDLAEVALEQTQALATLSQTLGVSVATVAGEPPTVTLPQLGSADALLDHRSDVLDAQLAVQTAQLSADAATRGVLPSGGISASYGTSNTTLTAGFATDTYQPSVSLAYIPNDAAGAPASGLSARLSLSIPLDSGSRATLAAANIGIQNAQQQLGQIQAQAKLELQATQNQLATAKNSLAAARALVAQRQQSLATTRTRLSLGLVAPYEVESAGASLLDAQVQFARLQDKVLLAQLSLLQTLSLNPIEVL